MIRTNLPSGLLEPLGLLLVSQFWASLLFFAAFSHRASQLLSGRYVRRLPTMPLRARSARVIHATGHAIAVPEIEFREIAMQVLLFAVLVDALHAALEGRIEALNRVGGHDVGT